MNPLGHRRAAAQGSDSRLPLADDPAAVALPSRRSLLKGGLLGIAGVVGWKAAEATSGGYSPDAAGAGSAGSLKLGGSGFRFTGEPTEAGALNMHGDLLSPAGAELGSFHSAPPVAAAGPAAAAQFQTFELRDGAIFGIGAAPAQGESTTTFAIVGGTGKYSGAGGSYVADLRPVDAGGDGSAKFDFKFTH